MTHLRETDDCSLNERKCFFFTTYSKRKGMLVVQLQLELCKMFKLFPWLSVKMCEGPVDSIGLVPQSLFMSGAEVNAKELKIIEESFKISQENDFKSKNPTKVLHSVHAIIDAHTTNTLSKTALNIFKRELVELLRLEEQTILKKHPTGDGAFQALQRGKDQELERNLLKHLELLDCLVCCQSIYQEGKGLMEVVTGQNICYKCYAKCDKKVCAVYVEDFQFYPSEDIGYLLKGKNCQFCDQLSLKSGHICAPHKLLVGTKDKTEDDHINAMVIYALASKGIYAFSADKRSDLVAHTINGYPYMAILSSRRVRMRLELPVTEYGFAAIYFGDKKGYSSIDATIAFVLLDKTKDKDDRHIEYMVKKVRKLPMYSFTQLTPLDTSRIKEYSYLEMTKEDLYLLETHTLSYLRINIDNMAPRSR